MKATHPSSTMFDDIAPSVTQSGQIFIERRGQILGFKGSQVLEIDGSSRPFLVISTSLSLGRIEASQDPVSSHSYKLRGAGCESMVAGLVHGTKDPDVRWICDHKLVLGGRISLDVVMQILDLRASQVLEPDSSSRASLVISTSPSLGRIEAS